MTPSFLSETLRKLLNELKSRFELQLLSMFGILQGSTLGNLMFNINIVIGRFDFLFLLILPIDYTNFMHSNLDIVHG